jgi:hypothetical protein
MKNDVMLSKTAFLVAAEKVFYMKMCLRKILHPISTVFGG